MPTLEEITKMADLIGKFYTLLIANSIPGELARDLTRDYFNNWLRWDDDDDNMELTPSPWYPQASKEFPGLDEVIRTGYK